ncbi:M48 family metallopeptidase [Alterisphingorhabdus coralli]|uniref:SprT family zinc-dependent metalloprotease n=1 Tax=Alterisphingorhabdus coralli TaxID=3071408 RepID=A0AA97I2K1_9SPHN|nr:SprT family zinc-dependent metalloprotease [Parasphingorhabdus sp. SCSIO 66989]WOE75830.1 SprT family zinc-dependent metalloprotease [Parasphingorhabdus sp. SCSIO 66989]
MSRAALTLERLLSRSARAQGGAGNGTSVILDGLEVPVRIKRHPRSRSLSMRIDPKNRGVSLTIAHGVPVSEALAFVHERKDWVTERLERLSEQPVVGDGAELAFRGEPYQVQWRADEGRQPCIIGDQIILGGDKDLIGRRLERWLRNEALETIKADAALYFDRAGIADPPRVGLTNARRRWGSCSTNSGLRIHWRLIMAPDMVRQSVVAHEVAHLRHMDHSADFYAWMDAIYQDNRIAADRWLKRHGHALNQLDFGEA